MPRDIRDQSASFLAALQKATPPHDDAAAPFLPKIIPGCPKEAVR